jgi:parallel beta-helix repeat protein
MNLSALYYAAQADLDTAHGAQPALTAVNTIAYLYIHVASAALVLCITLTSLGIAGAATVSLSPGANIQSAVNAKPGGTEFVLTPGMYRAQSVEPKTGDAFVGEAGALMDGARVLSGWTQASIKGVLYWTTAGGAPLGGRFCGSSGSCCMNAWADCTAPQNLYFDNADYGHANSFANMRSGRWYYDYKGGDGGIVNNIYLLDNPIGQTVELSAQNYAFVSLGTNPASNVTIENLIVEKYGTPIESGTIRATGPGWVIHNNEVRLNHGAGIQTQASDSVVTHNYAHDNGELGMGAGGTNGSGKLFTGDIYDSNIVVHNNIDNITVGFDGGGMKSVVAYSEFTNNVVHDNFGPGIWFDVHSSNVTIDHNTSYNNTIGIVYEISHAGTITNNTVYGNGWSGYGQNQISCASCDYTTIDGNFVTVGIPGPFSPGAGGIGISNGRADGFTVTHDQVSNNTITIVSGSPSYAYAGGLADYASPLQPSIFTDPTNYFENNIYYVPSLGGSVWYWGERSTSPGPNNLTWDLWHAAGQDLHGTAYLSSTQR